MKNYVCKGAKLKCSMGSMQSDLEVAHPASPVHLGENPIANIMDYKPMMNIMPFGQCKSLNSPCVPNTISPWTPGKADVLVKGQPALQKTDKCMCACAGIIEIA